MQKKYEKMHLIYQHSIDKVKMINQSSKVVLSKLQEVRHINCTGSLSVDSDWHIRIC